MMSNEQDYEKLSTQRLLVMYRQLRHEYFTADDSAVELDGYFGDMEDELETIKTILDKREHLPKRPRKKRAMGISKR